MSETIVCLGATSRIAEETLRLFSSKETKLLLVGRDQVKLDVIKQDLMARNPDDVMTKVRDFNDLSNLPEFANEVIKEVGSIDILFLAYGTLSDQDEVLKKSKVCEEEILTNFLSPVSYLNAFLPHFEQKGGGKIAVISSVAGDRGRATNIIYGSAKAGLNAYVEALGQKLHHTGVKVSLIKPGMVATPMITHLNKSGPLVAEPEDVATVIYNGIRKAKPIIYAPKYWALIMWIIRQIPSFVFRKLKF